MDCEEIRKIIDAYIDGELELSSIQTVEEHLRGCTKCSEYHERIIAVGNAIRKEGRYLPPPHLHTRIQARLLEVADVKPWRPILKNWLVFGAPSLVFGLLLMVSLVFLFKTTTRDTQFQQEVISSHVRSLMLDHLTDIASSDQHTVKPWFNGKLNFSPPVEDYTRAGFPLVGARLDYLQHHPAAALVYRHRQHTINLFILPSIEQKDIKTKTYQAIQQGYQLLHWTKAGLAYWVVSDLNLADMQDFSALIQGKRN